MKNTVILMLVGAIVGAAIASVFVPPALSWYASPGGIPGGAQVQAVVQIPQVMHFAISSLIRWQLIGGGIGAAAGLVLGIVLGSRGRREDEFRRYRTA
ncbi:MAG TPA: hypothetical protein VKB36_06265 [Vicinamibacterales bacterium]|nr:hypothetical protein [Vicinamibacterales bacterium]